MVSKFGFAPAENVAVPLTVFPLVVVPVNVNVSACADPAAKATRIIDAKQNLNNVPANDMI